MIGKHAVVVLYCFSASLAVTLEQEFKVSPLFGDQMVLQRDKPVRVFGQAPDGAKITVSVAAATASTVATGGFWVVTLPAQPAGGPYLLLIEGPKRLAFTDVFFGDIWLCAGQSNMANLLRIQPEFKEGRLTDLPQLRLFRVGREPGAEPAHEPTPDAVLGNAWHPATLQKASVFSATGYFFGARVHQESDVPIGLIDISRGATPIEAWLDEATFNQVAPYYPKTEYFQSNHAGVASFNGMVAPLRNLTIKGIIWYQGESNARNPTAYHQAFAALVNLWRSFWGPVPFYWVQVSSLGRIPWDRTGEAWAWLREAQNLKIDNGEMVPSYDLGDFTDIHPRRKREVGERLARVALAPSAVRGARLLKINFEDGRANLMFDREIKTQRVVMSDKSGNELSVEEGSVAGLIIAGEDKKFVPAQAKIQGNNLLVWSDAVKNPVAVRYAWANFAIANLTDSDGWPLLPFRTDDFPVPHEIILQGHSYYQRLPALMKEPVAARILDQAE